MNDGRLKAKLLRHEVSKYLSKMGFSCHYEVGLNRWGKLRADVLAFNYKRRLIVVEVKSSLVDYKTDKKWRDYLPFSNVMYFAFAHDFPLTDEIKKALKEEGVGILVVNLDAPKIKLYRSGSVKCVQSAARRPMLGEAKRDIVVRIAYRSGRLRTNHRTWLNNKE